MPSKLRRRWRRILRRLVTETRYVRLVWREFRGSLAFVSFVLIASTVILHQAYPLAEGELPLSWSHAAYAVVLMTTAEGALPYLPGMPIMVKVAFFALPVLGGFIIINTIVRFTELLSRSRHYSKEWQQMLATTFNHHVIVCGLGHVGTRIVEHLVAAGTDCVAIEQEDSPALRRIEALGVPVLIGDVRDADMLDKAQVKRADTLIAATDVDMANITAALIAREVNPAIKLVLRLFDQTLAKRIEKSLGINAAFSTSALAAPLFAAAATSRNVRGSVEIEGKVLHTVELEVRPDARLAGRMLDSLRAQLEVTFLMLHRGGTTDWNPSPSTVLTSGDRVLVVTTLESLSALEALNR